MRIVAIQRSHFLSVIKQRLFYVMNGDRINMNSNCQRVAIENATIQKRYLCCCYYCITGKIGTLVEYRLSERYREHLPRCEFDSLCIDSPSLELTEKENRKQVSSRVYTLPQRHCDTLPQSLPSEECTSNRIFFHSDE